MLKYVHKHRDDDDERTSTLPSEEREMKQVNTLGKTVAGLLTFGFASIITAEMLQSVNVPNWGDYGFIGAVLLFIAFAVLLGTVFRLEVLPAMDASSTLTGLLMAFIYVPAALLMGGLFALFIFLTYLAYRGESA